MPATDDNPRWSRVLAPWASNDGARLYTYMLAPELTCSEGDTILVQGPSGQAKFLTVREVQPHDEPLGFKCKPVALVIPKAEWEAHLAGREAAKAQVTDAAPSPPHTQAFSHHPDYPKWVVECEDMFVEGR